MYEYQVLRLSEVDNLEEYLNRLGKVGWCFCGIVKADGGHDFLLLEREVV